MIDKRTQNALADLQREIHLLAEEIEHQRDRKAIAEKRENDQRNQLMDDKAFSLMIEFDELDSNDDE